MKNKFEVPLQMQKKLKDPNLLIKIHKEIDKYHKSDIKEKLATFIAACSGCRSNSNERISLAFKGNSSAGKDNIIKTILQYIPDKWSLFLTGGTASALEDDTQDIRILAFSEMKKDGANTQLIETFKQYSEGGISTLKKDVLTGYKTTKRTTSDQKTLFYASTEIETDDELETRYIVIPIIGEAVKNKIVCDSAIDSAADPNYYISESELNKSNWIKECISCLDPNIQPIIPFNDILKNPIQDGEESKYLFDYTQERVKRDVKRLLNITKAIAWLHQYQRYQFANNSHKFIYCEPQDFLIALFLFADFINLTYSGLDGRLQRLLDYTKNNQGKHASLINEFGFGVEYSDWILRNKAQEDLGIGSVNTIKEWVEKLKDKHLIDVHYNPSVTNKAYLIRPIKSPISNIALPVSMVAVDTSLTGWLIGTKAYNNHIQIEGNSYYRLKDYLEGQYSLMKLTGGKLTCQFNKKCTVDVSIQSEIIEFLGSDLKSTDEIIAEFDELVEPILDHMKEQGVLYEPKSGFYGVLK